VSAASGETGAARQRDVALRDVVLRLLEDAGPTGTATIVQAGHPALRAVSVPYDGQLAADELAALDGASEAAKAA